MRHIDTNQKSFSLEHLKRVTKMQILVFATLAFVALGLDQGVKMLMLHGFSWESKALTIGGRGLVYNTGVAFSLFAFLEGYLKYIQILLLTLFLLGMVMSEMFYRHYAPLGILLGAGASNVLDRFMHGGVVDYVYWHYWFEFAIFNLADVLIDVSVVVILWQMLKKRSERW